MTTQTAKRTRTAPTIAATRDALIPINRITPSKSNPRRTFDQTALDELADSIRRHGLLSPIAVRPDPETVNTYTVIAGERRWKACAIAGLKNVPCRVYELGDQAALEIQMLENLQRENLDPIETARGYQQLIETAGMTQGEIGEALGKPQASIAHALRLLALPEDVQTMIADGRLSVAHGKALARWREYPAFVSKLAELVVVWNTSAKDVERGLPRACIYELEQAGVLKRISWDLPKAVNEAVADVSDSGYCWDLPRLKAAIDAEKQKAAADLQRRMAAAKKAADKAAPRCVFSGTSHGDLTATFSKVGDGETLYYCDDCRARLAPPLPNEDPPTPIVPAVLKLKDLAYGTYVQLDQSYSNGDISKRCGPESPCFREALEERSGTLVPVCVDPQSHRTEQRRETIATNKVARARNKKIAETVFESFDRDRFGDIPARSTAHRALVLMAAATLEACRSSGSRNDAARHLPEDRKGVKLDYAFGEGMLYERLDTLDDRTLIRIAAEAELRDELHFADTGEPRKAAWYVRDLLPSEEEKPAMSIDEARRKTWSYLRKHGYSAAKNRALEDVSSGELLHELPNAETREAQLGWDWPAIVVALKADAGNDSVMSCDNHPVPQEQPAAAEA